MIKGPKKLYLEVDFVGGNDTGYDTPNIRIEVKDVLGWAHRHDVPQCNIVDVDIPKLLAVQRAAEKILHWHDKVYPNGDRGMVVSFEAVQELWAANAAYRGE